MEHLLLILFGAVISWFVVLETRLRAAQKKIDKIARDKSDEQIRGTIKVLTDAELDILLSKDLSEAAKRDSKT